MRRPVFRNSGWICAMAALAVSACAPVGPQIKTEAAPVVIQDIQVSDQTDQTLITVVANRPIVYTSYELSDPQRLIIDLSGASVGKYTGRIPVLQGAVLDILPIEGEPPANIARLEIMLTRSVPSQVRAEGTKLVLAINKPVGEVKAEPAAPTVEAARPAPVPSPAPEPAAPPAQSAKTVTKLTYKLAEGGVEVLITGDGALKQEAFLLEGNRLVVDFPGVTSTIRPSVMNVKSQILKRIRIGQHTQKTRIVFDLGQKSSYVVTASGNAAAVTISAAAPAPAAPEEKKAAAPRKPPAPAPLPAAAPKPKLAEPMEEKHYTGRRISMDFQDAELSNILRLLADVSGYNIVISDDVKGKISIKLINVPWDQALDIILKIRNLGQIREGNIIRIATVAAITKQQDDEAKAKEAKVKAEDLLTRVIYVNYAKAEDLAEPLKKNLSVRGDITIDKRTNTMIVKDISKNIADIAALVKTLDTRTPQVLIEARIVQADTSFAQALGIQWGVGFRTISHNNIFGLQGIDSNSPPGFNVFNPGFGINLPATAEGIDAMPGVGFQFGRFTDNPITLDLRLSAGELNGMTKTISSPKVTTLDNVKAKIEQGESIPFQTTSQDGTQTTFVDANLTLEVTPHITSDRSIIMQVKAARNALGSFSGPAGPSIAKREASTQVLVRDGETTVIGGIFVDTNSSTETGVPILSKIPILGVLFKSHSKTDTKNELLIFLTPKIVED